MGDHGGSFRDTSGPVQNGGRDFGTIGRKSQDGTEKIATRVERGCDSNGGTGEHEQTPRDSTGKAKNGQIKFTQRSVRLVIKSRGVLRNLSWLELTRIFLEFRHLLQG